jgi:hypothetical protein
MGTHHCKNQSECFERDQIKILAQNWSLRGFILKPCKVQYFGYDFVFGKATTRIWYSGPTYVSIRLNDLIIS